MPKKKKKKEEELVEDKEPVAEPSKAGEAALKIAAGQRNIARYGTANPTESQILQSVWAQQQAKGQTLKGFPGIQPGVTPGQFAPGGGPEALKARRAGLEELGVGELKTELQEAIISPPSLVTETPLAQEGVLADIGRAGMKIEEQTLVGRIAQGMGVGLDPKVAPMKGALAALVAVGAGVAAVAPYVVSLAAGIAIPKAVLGGKGSVAAIKTAVAGLGLFVVGRGIFDYRGDEMDNLRSGLKKVVEDGERIEAAVRNGFPNSDSIALLRTMTDEVSSAESRIKELGNFNLQYRVSKEYILDTQNVRSAREALLRRVLAIENIALTGQAALNPEALMFTVGQFEGGAE